MNTAIEADDTHPELRDRARDSMTLWHRLIGRIVKDGKAAGTLAPTSIRTRSRRSSPRRSKVALMLSRLYDDPRAHRPRRRPPARARRDAARPTRRRRNDRTRRSTANVAEGVRTPHDHVDRSGAGALPRPQPERLRTTRRDRNAATLAPPPAAALLGMSARRGRARPHRVLASLADEVHENPMGTMHGGIVATLVDTAMGCAVSSMLPADAGFTTLELKTNYVRAITQSDRPRPRRRPRRALRRPRRDHRSARLRRRRHALRARDLDVHDHARGRR